MASSKLSRFDWIMDFLVGFTTDDPIDDVFYVENIIEIKLVLL